MASLLCSGTVFNISSRKPVSPIHLMNNKRVDHVICYLLIRFLAYGFPHRMWVLTLYNNFWFPLFCGFTLLSERQIVVGQEFTSSFPSPILFHHKMSIV